MYTKHETKLVKKTIGATLQVVENPKGAVARILKTEQENAVLRQHVNQLERCLDTLCQEYTKDSEPILNKQTPEKEGVDLSRITADLKERDELRQAPNKCET